MTYSPLSGFLKLVNSRCNNFAPINNTKLTDCYKFIVDGHFIGLIRPAIAEQLLKFNEVFQESESQEDRYVELNPLIQGFDNRSLAVGLVMEELRANSDLEALKGWRNEDFGIYANNREHVFFKMERAASVMFGVARYGVHVNGYTFLRNPITQKVEMFMWIAQRSLTKQNHPGMLDNIVAGGLTFGLGISDCVKKECVEEASIPEDLLEALRPAGFVSCMSESKKGISPNMEFCFDLELPAEFTPVNSDGEVNNFRLISIEQVKELICQDIFKPNSGLVVLDFLLRHGFINPDQDTSNFILLHSLLRRPFPFD